MKEIGLIPGKKEDPEIGAFDLAKMQEAGIDSMLLSQALAKALMPFARLLREGCGIGVIDKGDAVSVIGIAVKSTFPQP
ncbi:hypothetical protein K4L02_08610 [Phaeobacter inhibens]|uniref:hypothetical protein n=1 Tax=Phaeobacter inhibens TaxID=221822 RepID=UPI0021A42159|nr:hypothetical protein [Phaeobacter inhibens]UWR66267.1 hypothetical protein K4L02_08610 [Phaeobacter inhibens]